MSELFDRIINNLIIKTPFLPDLGLMNGRIGIAIIFYELALEFDNMVYREFADDIVDTVFEEINTNIPLNFTSGLTGIGWAIEYLIYHNFVDANADEVLDEIDFAIFDLDKKSPKLERDLKNFYGYGMYYAARTENDRKHDWQEEVQCLIAKDLTEIFIGHTQDEFGDDFLWSMQFLVSEIQTLLPTEIISKIEKQTKKGKFHLAVDKSCLKALFPRDINVHTDVYSMDAKITDLFNNNNFGIRGMAGLAWRIKR